MKKSLLFSLALVPAAAFAGVVGTHRQMAVPAVELKPANLSLTQANKMFRATNLQTLPLKSINLSAIAPKSNLSALYDVPAGVFDLGWSAETTLAGNNMGLGPVGVALTWPNYSTGATAYSWSYTDVEGNEATSTDKDLVTPAYPSYTMVSIPTLTATSASGSDSYSWGSALLVGGDGTVQFSSGNKTLWSYPMNFHDLIYDSDAYQSSDYTNMFTWYFDVSADTDAGYKEAYAEYYDNVRISSYSVIYPAPTSMYAIQSVNFHAVISKYTSETLNAAIYKVTDNGLVPMYEGKISKDEITPDASNLQAISIPLQETDGDLETEITPNIDCPIMVAITGFNGANDEIVFPSVLVPGELDDDASTLCYMGLELTKGSNVVERFVDMGGVTLKTKDGDVYHQEAIDIALIPYYTYINVDDDVISFSAAGETKEAQFESMLGGSYFNVSGDGEGDWWSWELGDYDSSTGLQTVSFTAAPLADGVHKNWTTAYLSTPGACEVIYLIQDDGSSVDSVEAANTSAKVVNGNFEVESANATAVAVYNLAGQKVAETTFEGKATVAAADLAKGVYVLKFNNNVVVKLAK